MSADPGPDAEPPAEPPAGTAGLGAGQLLLATPLLLDPNFRASVVLLLDHDDTGALGVILNRPSGVEVGTVLPDWAAHTAPPPVLHHGGPVGTDSAIAVGLLAGEAEPVGFRRVAGPVGIVDLDAPVEVMAPALSGLRVFAGYAGWGAGQLEAEVEEGSWYVVTGLPGDPFAADPDRLRRGVLRRQSGALAWLATMPADPSLN